MDPAAPGAIEAEGLSLSLPCLTPYTQSKGLYLHLITKCTSGIHKSPLLLPKKTDSISGFQSVPLSAPVPCSYHTRGPTLRVSIIHLNQQHTLVQCVCACVWEEGYAVLMQYSCTAAGGVGDTRKCRCVVWKSRRSPTHTSLLCLWHVAAIQGRR